jgi:hypothetical protein
VLGVLSALPIVNVGNACCCLWVVGGGLAAAYLLQQNQDEPITPGDGALVGVLAGVAGAAIYSIISIPIDIVMAPVERAMIQRVLDMSGTIPPNVRDTLERVSGQQADMGLAFIVMRRVVSFLFMLFVGGIFSTLGGLLGAVLFKKQK